MLSLRAITLSGGGGEDFFVTYACLSVKTILYLVNQGSNGISDCFSFGRYAPLNVSVNIGNFVSAVEEVVV